MQVLLHDPTVYAPAANLTTHRNLVVPTFKSPSPSVIGRTGDVPVHLGPEAIELNAILRDLAHTITRYLPLSSRRS